MCLTVLTAARAPPASSGRDKVSSSGGGVSSAPASFRHYNRVHRCRPHGRDSGVFSMKKFFSGVVIVMWMFTAATADAQFNSVGSLDFPTSGSPEAQQHFLRGVAILHSFGWKQAIAEFQAAQRLDPDFAMAYWGETLCYNHPLFGSPPDDDNPRAVLQRLGASRDERLAKAPTDREKGFLAAVEVLWGEEGAYDDRRVAYMEAMHQLSDRYPDDDEVATFAAVATLSAARALNDRTFRYEMQAGALALKVFGKNPNHPGAPHYAIHAFDDPTHAPLALPAALRYAEIAPAVAHARHMPTHIFIQHGMWDYVSNHNQVAYDVARDLWVPGDSVGDTVHALDWGQYGDLQLGDYAKARTWIQRLEMVARESDGQARAQTTLPLVRARYVVESEEWQVQPARQSTGTRQGRGWGVVFSFHSALNDSSLLVPMRVAYERLVFVWLILLRHVPEILTHREAFNQDKGAGV